MNRREVLQTVSILLGGTIIGGQAFLNQACSSPSQSKGFFSPYQLDLLNEIGETILPATETPGAKEANVAEYMQAIVADCYTEDEQQIFFNGLNDLENRCNKEFSKKFTQLDYSQKHNFLLKLDNEHIIYMKNKKSEDPVHYFRMLKELTLTGYFTSEPGATKFLKYVPVPGRYDGCTDQKPWA